MKRLSLYMMMLLVNMLSTGCDKVLNPERVANATLNTELGMLPKLISLPKQPKHVLLASCGSGWENNSTLVALQTYSNADYDFIVKNSEATEAYSKDVMNADFYEKWMPEKLKPLIKAQQKDDSVELRGIKCLLPQLFTQADLSPF